MAPGFSALPTMPHRKRLKRIDAAGHAHALTWSCWRRRPFLDTDRSRRWALRAINRARGAHPFDVWAYVLMPEHLHLLVCPTEREYQIAAFCHAVKSSVAKTAVAWVKREAPEFLPQMLDEQPNGRRASRFWQRGGGYDRNLTHADAVAAEIAYIHANPVRRGLCERPEDWSWSSAADYAGTGAGPLSLDLDSLPDFGDASDGPNPFTN